MLSLFLSLKKTRGTQWKNNYRKYSLLKINSVERTQVLHCTFRECVCRIEQKWSEGKKFSGEVFLLLLLFFSFLSPLTFYRNETKRKSRQCHYWFLSKPNGTSSPATNPFVWTLGGAATIQLLQRSERGTIPNSVSVTVKNMYLLYGLTWIFWLSFYRSAR